MRIVAHFLHGSEAVLHLLVVTELTWLILKLTLAAVIRSPREINLLRLWLSTVQTLCLMWYSCVMSFEVVVYKEPEVVVVGVLRIGSFTNAGFNDQ